MNSVMKTEQYPVSPLDVSGFPGKLEHFYVCKFEDYVAQNQLDPNPHRFQHYLILVVTGGSCTHQVDFKSYTLSRGHALLMHPGQVHAWEKTEDLQGYLFFFTDDFFSLRYHQNVLSSFPFFSADAGTSVIEIPVEDQPRIFELSNLTLQENDREARNSEPVLRSFLNIILYEFRRLFPEDVITSLTYVQRKVVEFKNLVEEHYKTLHQVRDYADQMALTPNYLNRIIREHTGMSAGEYIRSRLMLEAKRLLLHEGLTVSEISHALNFSSNTYFGRFFKQREGVSPDQFRKQITK